MYEEHLFISHMACRKSRRLDVCPILGPSAQLPTSDIPTNRDVLAYLLLLEESDAKKEESYKILFTKIEEIHRKINSNIEIITRKSFERKVHNLEKDYCNIRDKKKVDKQRFLNNLDRIFDVIHCRCVIKSCEEWNCSGCSQKAHIKCKCDPKKYKAIPKIELNYIRDQRARFKRPGQSQIQNLDVKTTHSMREKAHKKQVEGTPTSSSETTSIVTLDIVSGEPNESSSQESSDTSDIEYRDNSEIRSRKPPARKIYEPTKLKITAQEAERYGVSNRAAAAICTAILIDLGIIKTVEDYNLIITKDKIQRAKDRLRNENIEKAENASPSIFW